jgi:hypothetical protein
MALDIVAGSRRAAEVQRAFAEYRCVLCLRGTVRSDQRICPNCERLEGEDCERRARGWKIPTTPAAPQQTTLA